ncbi:hypothetical protein [Streptomyces sp. NPDC088258]|uniref:hypothetical protein n=1 Tax=Streptomyces sp. NPDC088258 TaxID=3365849 RepID=UPI0038306C4E
MSTIVDRFPTAGGATVEVAVRSGYFGRTDPTETYSVCSGCRDSDTVDWGWDPDCESGVQRHFDEGGKRSTPIALAWAKKHASRCRTAPTI